MKLMPGKSANKGAHLALAEHLDKVIGESIEVEEHPDRIKDGDVRDNSKINPDALMHRFYGVANIDGVDYRVMTLMKEENKAKRGNGIHSYEVQKIEVLDEETPNTPNGVGTPNSELEAYPLAKLLKDVGKTMEPGKKLLDESNKADERVDFANSTEQVRHSLSPSSGAFSDPMGRVRGAVERVGKAESRERDVKEQFDRTRQRGIDTADRILDDATATDEQRHQRMTNVIREVTRIEGLRKAGKETVRERVRSIADTLTEMIPATVEFTRGEVKRLIGKIDKAMDVKDVKRNVREAVNIVLKSAERDVDAETVRLRKTKGKRLHAERKDIS